MLAPSSQLPAIAQQPAPPASMPAPPPPKWHDVTVVTKKTYACARVEGVPPEEFGISRHARNLKDCGYCFHETLRTESELIDEGYDEKQVKGLPSHALNLTIESNTRDTINEGSQGGGDEGMNDANRQIKVAEHYIRTDWDGTGAKLWRVCTAGEPLEVLIKDGEDAIYEEEVPPFAAMTPVIMTHRFFGRSIADLILDIQRIKTALLRGLLDNQYLHNNPRVEVSESHVSDNTLDDLLVSRPGGIVRTKQPGGLNWQEVPDITASIYPALQYFDATREWRTGVSRQGQGVDPNALQNQVATIANQMFDAAQAKIRLIARIFAETGIKDLFTLLHGTIRKNGSVRETVQLRGTWVTVDPRDWKERNDLTIDVGLGTGSKQQQLAGAQLLAGVQKEAIPAGLVSPMNLHNTTKKLTRVLGYKNPDDYFTPPDPNNPASKQPIPMPPDPKQAEIQAKAQAEQAKQQTDATHQQLRLQFEQAQDQQSAQLKAQLAAFDAQLKERIAMMDQARKQAEHQMEMQRQHNEHQAEMFSVAMKHFTDMQKAHAQIEAAQAKAHHPQ